MKPQRMSNKTIVLIIMIFSGIILLLCPYTFAQDMPNAQNKSASDESMQKLANDLSNFYKTIYSEYQKQITVFSKDRVVAINSGITIHKSADQRQLLFPFSDN